MLPRISLLDFVPHRDNHAISATLHVFLSNRAMPNRELSNINRLRNIRTFLKAGRHLLVKIFLLLPLAFVLQKKLKRHILRLRDRFSAINRTRLRL